MWRGGGNRMIRPLCKQIQTERNAGTCEKAQRGVVPE
jgi:hypothetical protein